jgi:hypothetical protein
MTQRNAADSFEGWVSVGLLLLPGIPLWFLWDELLRWSAGYVETVAGVVIFLQAGSLLLLRPPLMRRIHDLSHWLDARKKQRPNKLAETNPALKGLQERLRKMPEAGARDLAAMGADLARQDREQNVRVALTQMMDRQAGANPPKMRFFLVDRSIPAFEPEPGSMLLLDDADGSWGEVKPSEVLGDEGSPEVDKEVFVSVVARLGASMPGIS